MTDTWTELVNGFEENSVSKNANGGTELIKRRVRDLMPADLMENFQVIPSRPRVLRDDKIRILWLHDLALDPEVSALRDPEYRSKFHKLVFVSRWQYEQFRTHLGIPHDSERCAVIENAIEPVPEVEKDDRQLVRVVYSSTPHRGLQLLVKAWPAVTSKRRAVLDVFSSYEIYGRKENDEGFRGLFDAIDSDPTMRNSGFVSNGKLREELSKAHVWVLPSVFPETSCLALIEGMSARCVCVHSDLAGLADTSAGVTQLYPYDENPSTHVKNLAMALEKAIGMVETGGPTFDTYTSGIKMYADYRFGIDRAAEKWRRMLEELVTSYPTAESRSVPESKKFVYRV